MPDQQFTVQSVLIPIIRFFDSGWFLALQIIGGTISFIFLVAIFVLIKKAGAFERHIRHLWIAWHGTPIPMHKMVKRWERIMRQTQVDNPQGWRLAIVEADNMLDEILRKIGYSGETIDERLEHINPEQFPSLEDAWRAHQIRTFIEQDPSYAPSREVLERTTEIYKKIFEETGIIL